MAGAGINHGDLLIVERCEHYTPGMIILAFADDQRLVRSYEQFPDGYVLCPANQRYRIIKASEVTEIFGRVIHSITHHLQIKQYLPVAN